MTSVSGSRPPSTPTRAPQQPAKPPTEDVRAMADAFAKAGRRMPANGAPAKDVAMPKGMKGQVQTRGEQPATTTPDPRGAHDTTEASVRERGQGERHGGGEGFASPQQTVQPLPVSVPQAPSPQLDPSAFAQMLADLWTRENGKGSKEVRVRFGSTAWPATGARLVRNAAGALDIAVQVGSGAAAADGLANLRGFLEKAGVEVGALDWDSGIGDEA